MFKHGKIKRTTAVGAIVAAGLALTACSEDATTSPDTQLIPVSFRLGFTAGGWDAGEYVALANGYFEEAGLDVSLTEGEGSAANIQLLQAGQIDIAKVALSSVVTAVSQGGTVIMVSSHLQEQGSGVVAAPEIRSAEQLDGATYAGIVYDFGTQLLPAFEAAAGVKLQTTMVDPSAIPQIFVSGQVQAMTSQAWAENIQLEVEGIDFSFFPYSEYGVDPVGVGYVVEAGYLDEHADIVERFVSAALKGWQFVYENPEQAAQIIIDQVPAIGIEVAAATTAIMEDYAHTEDSAALPLGEIAPQDVERTINLLLEFGLIDTAPAPEDVYSNVIFE